MVTLDGRGATTPERLQGGGAAMVDITAPGELAALVNSMIPGDGEFPPAASVGTHGVVAGRLARLVGREGLDRLGQTLGSLVALDAHGRTAAVRSLEQAEPDLFAALRMAVYLSYYEQPAVTEAVRRLGFAYNDAPLPDGYALDPFDPAVDAPTHQRGHYVRTDEVRRVDLSGLDFLRPEAR
jgi:hypothetical protein